MKNIIPLLLLFLLANGPALGQAPAAAPKPAAEAQPAPAEQPAPAADAPPAPTGGSFFFGTRALDNDGWGGRVNEYEYNRQGFAPAFGVNYWFARDSWFVDFFAENRGASRAGSYWLDADLNRRVRIRSSMERFLHRLDHDNLEDLDAIKGTVVVRHDNLAPNRAYVPGRNELKTEVTGAITSWLSWRAAHRLQQIHGEIQTRSISKCANCHVSGEATAINQKAHDIGGGLTARLGKHAAVHYDFTSRQFKEHGATPTNKYDVAQHPQTLSRVFFNRVQFDGTTAGEIPYALVPGFRKDTHDLKLNVDLPAESRLSAQLLSTSARNTHTNLDLNVLAWGGRWVVPIGSRMTFKAQFRKADMHSDDVFIQLEEPANEPGQAQAGLTYAQAYPTFGSADWTRGSSINRRDIVGGGDLSVRLARLTTLRGGYQFRSVRRENFEVDRTDRNRLYFLFNSRQANTWSARVRYTFDSIDEPFLHKHAALSPTMQPYASPGTPPSPVGGLQYFTMYAARQANLTNQPSRSHYFEPSFSWTPSARAALTVHYRTRIEKNDKLNYGDWSRDMHMPGAEVWLAPHEKLNFTFAYTFQNDKSNTLFVIPAFDG